MARRTLGQLLKIKGSTIPGVENLKNNEASAWLMTPNINLGENNLDHNNVDLRSDNEVPSGASQDYAVEVTLQNYNEPDKPFLDSLTNEKEKDSQINFNNTKFNSLTFEYLDGNSVAGAARSLEFGERIEENEISNYSFLKPGSLASDRALEHANVVRENKNFFTETNKFYDYTKLGDKAFINGLYSLAPWPKDESLPFGKAKYDRRAGKKVSAEDLNKATDSLLEKAVYFDDGPIFDIINLFAPTALVVQTVKDLKIKLSDEFSKVKDDLNANDEIIRTDESLIFSDLNRTYGAMTTPSKPYEGVQISAINTALAGVGATVALSALYSPMLKAFIQLGRSNKNGSEGASMLALFIPKIAYTILNELGLNYSDVLGVKLENVFKLSDYTTKEQFLGAINPYNNPERSRFLEKWHGMFSDFVSSGFFGNYDQFSAGLISFYGLNNSTINIFKNPSYYAIIARLILRDVNSITKSSKFIVNAARTKRAGDIANIPNVVLEEMVNSFSFKFFVKLMIIGNPWVEARLAESKLYNNNPDFLLDNFLGKDAVGWDDEKQKAFSFSEEKAKLIRYSRDRFGKTNKIMGESLLYFDHLFLSNVSTANELYSNSIKNPFNPRSSLQNRFDPKDIKDIEDLIDSEYVPFSIQDLRNNEIISLPAFIDSVSDSFTPNYETTNGFGRIDPIYSYSRTERSVSISFTLVSFNEDDHNFMYTIVNKLTSMCYPQRSRGEKRNYVESGKTFEFYQPFSQVQTASPMVRIRLGDLIASNRNSFSMQAIFGDNLHHGRVIGNQVLRPKGSISGPEDPTAPFVGKIPFDAVSNPIVRSFNSASGRGLAGFITSLGFDYEGSTWGIRKDQFDRNEAGDFTDHLRAPKKIKVSITFAPVHDMPLGLDYAGRMFAPTHPVGTHSVNFLDDYNLESKINNSIEYTTAIAVENGKLEEIQAAREEAQRQAEISSQAEQQPAAPAAAPASSSVTVGRGGKGGKGGKRGKGGKGGNVSRLDAQATSNWVPYNFKYYAPLYAPLAPLPASSFLPPSGATYRIIDNVDVLGNRFAPNSAINKAASQLVKLRF
jgi:hypothetical protein